MEKKESANKYNAEIDKIKNTVERILEFRTDKIVRLASEAVKVTEPTEALAQNLTPSEKEIFYKIVELLGSHRKRFFRQISTEKSEENSSEIQQKNIIFRVKKSMPEFVGPDMKIYKLEENQVVDLPQTLNDLLLKKGVIEKIEE
jgi:DNA replication initiation complex subunit (GINS family)